MLRTSPRLLEPLLEAISRLESGRESSWYLEQIRATAQIVLNDESKTAPLTPAMAVLAGGIAKTL